ncbi:HD domain-containing protein [Pseudodesulfovibrio sp.]|nr:HD domain-containing protein [Pseudodesulfovibrio sp.]
MHDVYLLDLIQGISGALDYVSTSVTGHHRRVGVASASIAATLGLDSQDTTDLLMAALLHDIGAFSLDLKLDGLDFDADLTEHSQVGYRLLREHPILSRSAHLVLFHHTPWRDLQDNHDAIDEQTLFLGNVLNLMDRVDVLSKVGTRVFDRERIRNVIGNYSKLIYSEAAIDAFMEVSNGSNFWNKMEDSESPLRDIVGTGFNDHRIPQEQLLDFSRFFSHIIDFRSRHTATHSQGVAETAVQLSRLAGMSEEDQNRMRLAGNLHDIGKLAVPAGLLDKPAKLDDDEYAVMQNHAVVCEKVLHSVPGLEDIADWACQHHERINGKGYPHGMGAGTLSLGSRILAVADVYTAISEDRPYRDGMTSEEVYTVLHSMTDKGFLDKELVELLMDNFEHIDSVRRIVQTRALSEFKRFRTT